MASVIESPVNISELVPTNTKRGGGINEAFTGGGLELSDETTKDSAMMLKQLREVVDASGRHNNRTFQSAMFTILRSPNYNHERMVKKMSAYGAQMKSYNLINDYLRAIEEVYNYRVALETDKVRLF